MSAGTPKGRISSMDQFRGYTVAGMFLVNFIGGLEAVHHVFKHNNTYFSYADSILPSFLFAAGFSYRLTMLRRVSSDGRAAAYRHTVVRGLALILLSLLLFGPGDGFDDWGRMTPDGVRIFVAKVLKANLWEVLAIIGAGQILILPVVTARPAVRVLTMVAFLAGHAALSYFFNYEFVYGRPNPMDRLWGAAGTRAWDGGFFGLLTWSVPMLGGTLAYDVVASTSPAKAGRLIGWGALLMVLGYMASCLTTLYDVTRLASSAQPTSPVLPPLTGFESRPLASFLAEWPFVKPPPESVRQLNYWMMDKRVVTASFALFGTGFAGALYGLFVLACDRGGWGLDLFRILGQNPLAAYIIHHPVENAVRSVVPHNAPLWWGLIGFAAFFALTVLCLRYLDRHKLFLRL